MMIVSRRPGALPAPLIGAVFFLILFGIFYWINPSLVILYVLFYLFLLVGLLGIKIPREVRLEGDLLTVTYRRWGREGKISFDTSEVYVKAGDIRAGRTLRSKGLYIGTKDFMLLFRVMASDGFAFEELQAVADEVNKKQRV
ncbi:MAG: hypothetical protein QM731_08640 [Chitinophagaceae bacterium]